MSDFYIKRRSVLARKMSSEKIPDLDLDKINGVAIQCIRHSILAIEPILSGLYIIEFIIFYIMKSKYIVIATLLQLIDKKIMFYMNLIH